MKAVPLMCLRPWTMTSRSAWSRATEATRSLCRLAYQRAIKEPQQPRRCTCMDERRTSKCSCALHRLRDTSYHRSTTGATCTRMSAGVKSPNVLLCRSWLIADSISRATRLKSSSLKRKGCLASVSQTGRSLSHRVRWMMSLSCLRRSGRLMCRCKRSTKASAKRPRSSVSQQSRARPLSSRSLVVEIFPPKTPRVMGGKPQCGKVQAAEMTVSTTNMSRQCCRKQM
mmetsp:Transcript_4635/g.12735  ORF Transcript_4635/g.12735 Transcript_4635/m.12735 type:complete len:227 (-) Transcript_4635:184-864(-)